MLDPIVAALRLPLNLQTYRNWLYLLLGFPLGTIWFTIILTLIVVGVGLIPLALIGVPVLLGSWYVVHWFTEVERWATISLLGLPVEPLAPVDHGRGNPWTRLRHVSSDAARWRELRFLLLRFPLGIATFTLAVALPTIAATLMWTPFYLRSDDHDWGTWPLSTTIENLTSAWSWLFVPAGLIVGVVSLWAMNWLAKTCGRLTALAIGYSTSGANAGPLVGAEASRERPTRVTRHTSWRPPNVEEIWRESATGAVTDPDEIDVDNR